MIYNQNFIRECEELYKKIQQNGTIQECLNAARAAAAAAAATTESAIDIYEPLWFIYYMFFAIHNPKMEDYIQKKSTSTVGGGGGRNPQDIIKNLLKRRNYTSTIVFQLYTHAYTNEGNVSYIYPKYKNNIAGQLIKSFQGNNLKTTAVLLRKQWGDTADTADTADVSAFVEYIITTQPTTVIASASASASAASAASASASASAASASASASAVLHKINNDINYKRKDLILLALVCYMKVDEHDINKKNIFIMATDEELNAPAAI